MGYILKLFCILLILFFSNIQAVLSGGLRDHTRPNYKLDSDERKNIEINQDQANELTLTLVKVERQDVNTWVRLAADIDGTRQLLTSVNCGPDIQHQNNSLIKVGQRVLVFSPSSKSSVYRASVFVVEFKNNCLSIKAKISRKILRSDRFYIMEILIPRGRFLVVPKEAIIEEADQQIVYVKTLNGQFIPKRIRSGLKGDLYTEIKHGLREGEQVVTLGSFFIDAQYKLNNPNSQNASEKKGEASHAHHHH